MRWIQSETAPLAKQQCGLCFGLGIVQRRASLQDSPCGCVLREIFRICYEQFQESSRSFGAHEHQQYALDFQIVARRHLSLEDYNIFREYFVNVLPWQGAALRLRLSRSGYFDRLYRIEERLGRAYADIRPHALYPTAAYLAQPSLYHRQHDALAA